MSLTNTNLANERFAALIDALGFTQVSISQLVGISQGYVSQLMSGRRSITVKVLQSIARIRPEVNVSWVLTGEGSMFFRTEREDPDVLNEPMLKYGSSADPFEAIRSMIDRHGDRIKKLEDEVDVLKEKLKHTE